MKPFLIALVLAALLFAFIVLKPKTEEEKVFYTALENFTYIREPKGVDLHYRYTSHETKFAGDCEDFAFTLQGVIGGEVWVVKHNGVTNHAVLLVDGAVYDNFYQMPISKNDYPTKFIKPLEFRGKIINNTPSN